MQQQNSDHRHSHRRSELCAASNIAVARLRSAVGTVPTALAFRKRRRFSAPSSNRAAEIRPPVAAAEANEATLHKIVLTRPTTRSQIGPAAARRQLQRRVVRYTRSANIQT